MLLGCNLSDWGLFDFGPRFCRNCDGDLAIDFLDHGSSRELLGPDHLHDIFNLFPPQVVASICRVVDQGFLAVRTTVGLEYCTRVFRMVLLTPSTSLGS